MMNRIRQWRHNRPYHKIRLISQDTGKRIGTLKFSDPDWTQLLLALGALGYREIEAALIGALQIAALEAERILEQDHAVEVLTDTRRPSKSK